MRDGCRHDRAELVEAGFEEFGDDNRLLFRLATRTRLHAINPRMVMARVTAFGQTGPLRQGPGYAAIGSAFGGTWYVNGPADRPP